MKNTLLAAMGAGGVVLAFCPLAPAGPLETRLVAPDAQWVVHFDIEAALHSTLGTFVATHRAELDLDELDHWQQQFGIDPFSDLKSLTVYGSTGSGEDAVAIIRTTDAVDGLVQKARELGPGFETLTDGDHTLYAWSEDGATRYGHVRPPGRARGNDRLVMIAQDKKALLNGIGVVAGSAPGMTGGGGVALPLGEGPGEGSILFVAARGSWPCESDEEMSMLARKADGARLDLGEIAGDLYADLTVTTASPGDATDISQMLQGGLALGRMMAKGEPEFAGLADLAGAITFATDGQNVTASCRYQVSKLIETLKALDERRDLDNDEERDEPEAQEPPKKPRRRSVQ